MLVGAVAEVACRLLHDLKTGLLRGRGVHLVGKLAFGMAAMVAHGKGAHSQSNALCERLKQYLYRSLRLCVASKGHVP